MKEIYCSDCRFVRTSEDCMGGVYYNCKAEQTYKHNAVYEWWVMAECLEKNKNNNCKSYKRKRWKF